MGLVIGIDEAGYGPNLGPLVITASVWEVPGSPRETDFWTQLAEVVSQERPGARDRLHIADSKQVYSPGRGLQSLERGILSVLSMAGAPATSLQSLTHWLTGRDREEGFLDGEPWYRGADLPLPLECEPDKPAAFGERLNGVCESAGIRLKTIRSDIVLTERFNALVDQHDSKGLALSRTTLALLRSVWNPDGDEPVLVISDKHGGRNRYDDLLAEQLDGQMILRLGEGREKSTYRVGRTELVFRMGAEACFPVAVSSMVCKYVRETCMELFNRFWQEHQADLKPTKGYPEDARRFRQDIAETQSRLNIPDRILWRSR